MRAQGTKGGTLVEAALTLPILILFVLAITEYGRMMFIRSALFNAAREGARYGVLHPTYVYSENHADPGNIVYQAKSRLAGKRVSGSMYEDYNPNRSRFAGLDPNLITVIVEYPDGGTKKGNRLRVRVRYTFRSYLPVPGTRDRPLTGIATMEIE